MTRLATERVRANGHVVTFAGKLAVRVERIVGFSPRMGLERTRKVWERGAGRKPSIRATQAIIAAADLRAEPAS